VEGKEKTEGRYERKERERECARGVVRVRWGESEREREREGGRGGGRYI
jgi:hypothetical protein